MAEPDAPRCRLLATNVAGGAWNMAADEVLLQTAAAGIASFRFYCWNAPTLSLGYFQPLTVRQTNTALAALAYVRRSTGGAALVHHHELTYALALPAGSPWQTRGQSWLIQMHTAIAQALMALGIEVQIVAAGEERRLGDDLCFLHQTPGDLVVRGHKVVGSAQRKQKGALLQHGAILLAQSAFTPQLRGLHDLVSCPVDSSASIAREVLRALQAETGWQFDAGDRTVAETALHDRLARSKYGSPSWNDKR